MPSTVDMAHHFNEMLESVGRIHKQEARQWIEDNDDGEPEPLDAKRINMVLGWGMSPARRWWHKEGDYYVAGAPLKAPESDDSQAVESEELTEQPKTAIATPTEALQGAIQKLGVKREMARNVAEYLTMAWDVYDAEQFWRGLKDCTELTPSQRNRVMRYWVSMAGLQPSDETRREYTMSVSERAQQKRSEQDPQSRHSGKWIPINGECVQVDEDDPDGMSFYRAYQLAMLQRRDQGTAEKSDLSVMASLFHEWGETNRKQMELSATRNGNSSHNRYTLVGGQVMPTSEDDPEGMPLSQAARLAHLHQSESQQERESYGEGLAQMLLRQQHEERLERLQSERSHNSNGDQTLPMLLDSQQKLSESNTNTLAQIINNSNERFTLMMQKMEDDRRHDRELHDMQMERLREERKQEMEHLKEEQKYREEREERERRHREEQLQSQHQFQMDLLRQQVEQKNVNWIDAANQTFPGLGEKMVNMILNPPQPNPGPTIKLSDDLSLSLDQYERWQNIENKRNMTGLFMQHIPDFFTIGAAAAESLRGNKGETSTTQTAPPQQPEQTIYEKPCASCQQPVAYRSGDTSFMCPHCGVAQTVVGHIIQQTQTTPAPSPTPRSTQQAGASTAVVSPEEQLEDSLDEPESTTTAPLTNLTTPDVGKEQPGYTSVRTPPPSIPVAPNPVTEITKETVDPTPARSRVRRSTPSPSSEETDDSDKE